MSLLDELKARGVQDICIACVDGLSGFKQAIQAINRPAAEQAFDNFKNKWNPLVPLAVRVWENSIEEVYQLFNFPKEISKNDLYNERH